FSESAHGFYLQHLVNITPISSNYGLKKWMEEHYNLTKSQITVSFEVRSDDPRKSDLNVYLNVFDYETRKDTTLEFSPTLAKKWESISWSNNFDQNESYVSFLF